MFYSKNNLFVLKEYIDIPLHRLIYMSVKYPTELKLSEADKKEL